MPTNPILSWYDTLAGNSPEWRSATVLILEDDESVAALYREWLTPDYDVVHATDLAGAREAFSAEVDIALVDRRLSTESGTDFLDYVDDVDTTCRSVIVSAVEPGFDIVDLSFDDYLHKPVRQAQLRQTVANLVELLEYDEEFRELYSLTIKKALLDAVKPASERQANDAYATLTARIDDHSAAYAEEFDAVAEPNFDGVFRRARITTS